MLRVSVSQTLELFLFQFFSSLKFHQAKVLGPMQALGEVMGLGKAMGKAGHAKAHGGGGKPWSMGPIGGEKAPRLGESSLSFSITSSCFFRLRRSLARRF